jgi:ABC-type Na+ efflux pump permease subunit
VGRKITKTGGLACLAFAAMGLLTPAASYAATTIVTETLSAQVRPIGKVSVPANLTLNAAGTTFQNYSGTLTVSFRVRTTPAGNGSITLKATGDFSPAGGPTIASGGLTYTCGAATLGSVCSGTQTASTASQTSVATLPASACTGGGGSCSGSDPNTVQVNLTLVNSPTFKTGTYSASLTFSISSI